MFKYLEDGISSWWVFSCLPCGSDPQLSKFKMVGLPDAIEFIRNSN